MAYKIINQFIPTSKHKLKAPYAMTPQYVTIHNTANDASALNEIAYMTRNGNAVSYHVAIDDKHAVQAIPFSRNAFAAGDGKDGTGNRKSIHLEICYSKSGGSRYYAAEENTVEYTAHVLKQYGWGIDRIKWHRDWSGKHCPHRMIDEGRLDSFKKRVQAKLDELNGKVKPAAPEKEKEVDEMAQQLPQTQKDDMRNLLTKAYKDGTFSADHTKKVDTMTRGQATDLMISYVARTAK